ncbi:hypothetical protein AVDCRST_MAG94-6954 [uncultured Leptolyngbya sp.]|uniref:Uncharacterized protein n=1 Tax=uncultured Leptolyngbya sp. TaxID=332963 RepID=A0A6J4PV82_9CYAN|nr:hypothetical protein AVDCRST_MAG94-6954 [uncultured Leptolyngbya sp.]
MEPQAFCLPKRKKLLETGHELVVAVVDVMEHSIERSPHLPRKKVGSIGGDCSIHEPLPINKQ